MRRSFVIAFTVCFVTAILAKDIAALTWDLWYLVNKDYVARELCENKARPEMRCNGKCHLAKRLERLEEPSPAPVKQKLPGRHNAKPKETCWIVGSECAKAPDEPQFSVVKNVNGWIEHTGAPRSFSSGIFHPPTRI